MELILDEEEDNLPMQSKVQSFPEVGTRIKELLNNRQFKQAADLWKQYKYQILDLSPAENYNLLKIICKVRDKQIEGIYYNIYILLFRSKGPKNEHRPTINEEFNRLQIRRSDGLNSRVRIDEIQAQFDSE